VVDEGLAARRALMITGPLYCPVSNPSSSLLKSYLEVDRGPVDFVFPKAALEDKNAECLSRGAQKSVSPHFSLTNVSSAIPAM
jgi:hypothetical protein